MPRRCLIAAQALCLIATPAATADEIDEIFVTAVRRAVDADQLSLAIETIGGESLHNDLLVTDALGGSAGVTLQQTTAGQGAAIVRGQKGSAVLHLVDGMRLNNAIFRSAPTQYFALVPALAVERIEVLRGTPTSLYGSDAIGGVVQLVMRWPEFDPAAFGGEAQVTINTGEAARRIGATVDAGNARVVSSLSAEYADIGDRRIGGGGEIRPSAYTSRAARWLLASKFDRHSEFALDLQFAEQPRTPRSDELVPGFGQAQPSSSEFEFRPNRRTFVHADYSRHDGPFELDWNVDLAWQRIDDDRQSRDFAAPERSIESNRSDLLGLTISGSRHSERGSWIAGIDAYRDDVSSRRISEEVATAVRSPVTARFPDGSRMRLLSAYANSTRQVGKHHALTLGVRLSDVHTQMPGADLRNTDLGGDLGWVATLNDRWQLRGNLGYGFRAPNVFDLGTLGSRPGNRFNIPNADLDSERVVHGDIGLRFRSPRSRIDLHVFALRYRDRITSVATGDVTPDGREITQSVNAATATVRGVELSAALTLAGPWRLIAAATHTWGEQRIRGPGTEPGDRIPPLNGEARVEFDPQSAWSAAAWVRFADGQSRLSARDVRDPRIDPRGTPGWASAGARVNWQPDSRWLLTIQFDNVVDQRYRLHGSGIDARGRNLSVSMRWRF